MPFLARRSNAVLAPEITNRAAGLAGTALDHEEVLTIAAATSTRLADLLERFLAAVDSEP